MKNKYLQIFCLLVAIGVVTGGSAWWALRDRIPTPTPIPTPAVSILGPSTVQVAELVVLVAEGKVDSYAWLTVPPAQQRVMEGGKLLILVFDSPGRYTAVLGVGNNGTTTLLRHLISVEGDVPNPGPDPDPDPEPEPEPEPEPDPDPGGWVKWTHETVLRTVDSPERAVQAAALAGGIRSVVAKIAAGAISSPKQARVELRAANNRALGKGAIDWAGFSTEFAELCVTLELRTLKQYREIYLAVAKGLDKVAVEKEVTVKKKKLRRRVCKDGRCYFVED